MRHVRNLCARGALGGLLALALAAGPASAQSSDPLDELPQLPSLADNPKNLTLLSISSATVVPGGMGFASLSFTSDRPGPPSGWDGSLALGYGFGDADETLGIQLTAQVTALTETFADSGFLELKASRRVSSGRTPVYLGAEVSNFVTWGDANVNDISGKLMVSWFPTLDFGNGQAYPLMLTAGVGSHIRNNHTDPGGFFGVGIGLNEWLGASMSWTGETLDVGLAFQPRGLEWGNFTIEANDITDRMNSRRVSINFNVFMSGLFRS